MTPASRSVMLVVADPAEWPEDARIRGTGGWIDPQRREALDWATLGRFMGWSVAVARLTDPLSHPRLMEGSTFVVFACDLADVPPPLLQHFMRRLATEPLVLVTRGGWRPGGSQIADSPDITKEAVGQGAILRLGLHPSAARDASPAVTRALQQALVVAAMRPIAWLDHSGTLVLRMDDPGGAQNVHWKRWYSRKLTAAEWRAVGVELQRRNGRLSIGYIPEWVDDGDAERGDLWIGRITPPRAAGRIHDSSRIVYTDRNGHEPGTVHDYASEFRGIQALRRANLAEVELHGGTHMHPDVAAWAVAADRYESASWFRELGHDPVQARRALGLGIDAFARQFAIRPTTLVCPGDEWTNDVLECALDHGIQLVGSYYLAIRDGASFWWCTHVCAPYFDQPGTSWFEAPLPVVGYCHDRDLVLNGVDWWRDCLDRWCAAGASRIVDYRQVAVELSRRLRVDDRAGELRLTVSATTAQPLVKGLHVRLRCPDRSPPEVITACVDNREAPVRVERAGDLIGRLVL
jgi:hypothetical protein